MCSGKSTVGRLLADRLGWELIDFDETIERREERRIADVFRENGESHFRRLEAELTAQVEARKSVVLVPGGGWVTQHGLVERLRPSSLFVWLRVQPDDPRGAIQELLAAREPLYRQADVAIDTDDRLAEEVAEDIVDLLRPEGVEGRE